MLPASLPSARPLLSACFVFGVLGFGGASLGGCSKKNSISQAAPSTQGGTCTTACQHLATFDLDDDKSTSVWCGRVFTSEVKGGGLTACIERCEAEKVASPSLDCATSADSCEAVDACDFLLPPA
jgi:hypothetical protein